MWGLPRNTDGKESVKFERSFLHSRVARRIFGLFILSALIPVIITGTLSFDQVTKSITHQTYAQLRQISKFYGLSIYDRLLMASSRLQEIASELSSPRIKKGMQPEYQFSAIALVYGLNNIEPIVGVLDPAVPLQDMIARKLSPGQYIVTQSISSSGSPQVFMGLFLDSDSGMRSGVLIGQLKANYLWSEDTLSLNREHCILTKNTELLFCTGSISESVVPALKSKWSTTASGTLKWEHHDETFLAGYWELFLEAKFHVPGWLIVVGQNANYALAPIMIFKQIYPPVIALSIVIVALLSVRQIRRTLIPLEKLIKGMRRIGNREFDTRIHITSKDEFAELAMSMNEMSDRLGRQFNALATLSEMDRQILSTLDAERILSIVLGRIHKIVTCQCTCITLIDRHTSDMAVNYIQDNLAGNTSRIERIRLDQRALHEVVAHGEGLMLEHDVASRNYFTSLSKSGIKTFFVLPISYRACLYGIITLGYAELVTVGHEDQRQVRDFADRIAVALSVVEREEKLYRQAHYDTITGLPNRQLFHDRLNQQIAQAHREPCRIALLFIDLDRFKNVNDTAGHSEGDRLLKMAAIRLQNIIGETNTVARIMGDEFTIILSKIANPRAAGIIADKVITQLSRPFIIGPKEHYLGASVGIAIYPDDGKNGEELLKNADTAMYKAKEDGRGRKMFYTQRMNAEISQRMQLEKDLRYALSRNELFLLYQPQVELSTYQVIGAESLIRWQHPERGLIPPNIFISLAEESGLIEAIGEWILETACKQYMNWQAEKTPIQNIAVNVSARQLKQADFLDKLRAVVTATGIPPECLEIEITESLLMENLDHTVKVLNEIHNLGVKLSINDFGTGYSSLSYLQKFTFDTLKMDQSLVKPIATTKNAEAIANAIIVMAHTLNKKVVAEGVETDVQLAFLREHRCDIIQGYYFSRPLQPEQFCDFTNKMNSAYSQSILPSAQG
jgi:diguanylate cyclase (GGDEF)-like protein